MARPYPHLLAAMLAAMTMLGGCAQVGVPMPPSLELPKPVNDLRAFRKGNQVVLTWTVPSKITEGGVIRHLGPTRICRSQNIPMTQCDSAAGEIPPVTGKVNGGNYTDTLPESLIGPNAKAMESYAVEVLNSEARSAGLSNQVRVPLLPTLPPPESLLAQVTPQGVMIAWRWPTGVQAISGLEYKLRIYRRAETAKDENKVGEVELSDQAEPKFLDANPEWEKIFYYRASWVTVAGEPGKEAVEVEGADSPETKVVVHDVFPPAEPTGLQAVFSSVGQPNFIDLTWTPNSDAELAGYNVYRREEGGTAVKINSELAKIPTYRDRDIQPGRKYFYSLSAVDVRGNESERSAEAAESVP